MMTIHYLNGLTPPGVVQKCTICGQPFDDQTVYTYDLEMYKASGTRCTTGHVVPLSALGKTTQYVYDNPTPALLERFKKPTSKYSSGTSMTVDIKAPEFTSLCPITGQPDFATIVISYVPDQWCVESKSLKLYLGSYRMHGDFHEACTQRICDDLVELLQPVYLRVEGQFTPRGGIPFWPTVEWEKPFTQFSQHAGDIG